MSASALPSQTPTLHEEHLQSGVDVGRAEDAFHTLERVATTASAHELVRVRTRRSQASLSKKGRKHLEGYDAEEKAELGPDEQPFDLRDYLSSANDKATQHGIKNKRVGVTWEDLQVDVVGGMNHKVRSFPFGAGYTGEKVAD